MIIPPDLREGHEHGLARVRSGGDRQVIGRTVELRAIREDGGELPVELSLASWRLDQGEYYTGILRDITVGDVELGAFIMRCAHAEPVPLATLRPELPAPVCALVGRAMARDPGERPSALALVEELRGWVDGAGQPE